MKKWPKHLLLQCLFAILGLLVADQVSAQTFVALHGFPATPSYPGPYTNSDGAESYITLTLSGNTLYGTANLGGSWGAGTIFAVAVDGVGFTNLHSFAMLSGPYPQTNSDGGNPYAGLALSGDTLYGVTFNGGGSGLGTVFSVKTDGTGFTNLHSFVGGDGANPSHALTVSGGILYGTSLLGGGSRNGTVFAIKTDGTGFTNLYSFSATSGSSSTNSDGANPVSVLAVSGNTLYGTAQNGGSLGDGAVFAINTDGTGFTNLHSFGPTFGSFPQTNDDGATPFAGVILSGGTLYGATGSGGSHGFGTVFAIRVDGTGFNNLHSFDTNGPGYAQYSELTLSSGALYGTSHSGGSSGFGSVFAINTDGTGFTNLHSFTTLDYSTNSDGAYPYGGLTLSNNVVYGTTTRGGGSGNGTVFSLSMAAVSAPPLTILPFESQVVLMWPTNSTGFVLKSATNLISPVTWEAVSPGPVIVNGQNAVTNSVSGTQQYYRLSR